MSRTISIEVPMNRVEGDLEIRAELRDGVVEDAFCAGTMYRGFETILVGRAACDGLVIAPRICGICSTSHLTAAARALDMISGAPPPPDAVRIRNLALMAEHLQSDMRQAFLMFAVDFPNPAYAALGPLHAEAVRRYEPFRGDTVVSVIRETKKVVELIAILGGQWPHSSFIVPGGIVSVPGPADLLQCRHILRQYRRWYEERILGCSVARWRDVRSAADLSAWLEEDERHRQGDLGFVIRFARALGLDAPGRPSGGFLSYGALELPEGTSVTAPGGGRQLVPGGFANGGGVQPFDQARIAEHVAYSWFEDQEGGRHPLAGETRPYATGHESRKYSWAKAPRYEGLPAETGPLAEALVAGDALFTSLVGERGPSVLSREMARLVRPASLLPAMETWLGETGGDFYRPVGEIVEGTGFGLTQATRGALGHWVRIEKGRIERYQVIAPTTWNASPRDGAGVRGPMEEALVGTAVKDPENPVELGHVVRSFDPCLVCTVHAVSRGRSLGRLRVGA